MNEIVVASLGTLLRVIASAGHAQSVGRGAALSTTLDHPAGPDR